MNFLRMPLGHATFLESIVTWVDYTTFPDAGEVFDPFTLSSFPFHLSNRIYFLSDFFSVSVFLPCSALLPWGVASEDFFFAFDMFSFKTFWGFLRRVVYVVFFIF